MTLYEFNALEITEKAEAVWHGTFLADREADGLVIQLYILNGCYVELFYDRAANKIKDFHAFSNKQLLALYLAPSKFPL